MSGAMRKLVESDLLSLERYSRERNDFRARVIAHKKHRQLSVGPSSMWLFEDRLTIQYQVQEMLRTERIFEAEGIAEELAAYNPLIPDGLNWKATLLLEFPDPEIRRVQLEQLRGVEHRCWVRAGDGERVFAIADEDLPRENDTKTSAVHFLRFELGEIAAAALKRGAVLAVGIDHPNYRHELVPVPDAVRRALLADLD
jgi:Protein of unknown function (DUF3501)